jgi:hypothetical protein
MFVSQECIDLKLVGTSSTVKMFSVVAIQSLANFVHPALPMGVRLMI